MRRTCCLFAMGVSIAFLAACGGDAEPPTPEVDPATERSLSQGDLLGFTSENGAHVWRNIPFAQPPVGALRWRAPQPADGWEGPRTAVEWGERCVQFAGFLANREDKGPSDVTGSEDCLSLNVFAPPFEPGAVPSGSDRLPVMVWIHGGGNSIGDPRPYDASRLAVEQGVVVVSVQYRLGILGWLRHPALHGDADTLDDRSGNFGTLDLVRSLEWVRNNASAFGGDPGRVTIFGESAGGMNVYSLLLSPRARGLFQRAISQSGGTWTSSLARAEHFADDEDPGDALSSRELLLDWLERDGDGESDPRGRLAALSDTDLESYLRGQPAGDLLSVIDAAGMGGMYRAPTMFRDGHVLPRVEAIRAIEDGAYNRVPVILGTNRDESKLFMLFSSDAVTRVFGLPLWFSDESRYQLVAEYGSRMWKAFGVDEPAAAMSRVQEPSVFAYRFDWDEQPTVLWADFSKMLGAAHALEIPFVMGNLDLGPGNRFVFDEDRLPAAEKLSDAMMSYWGQFAHGSRPDRGRDGSLPLWSAWDSSRPDAPKFVVFDTEEGGGIRMSSKALTAASLMAEVEHDDRFRSNRERCEVYAGFVLWSETMTREAYTEVADGLCRAYPLDEWAG